MAFKNLLARCTELCAILLQALLNRRIVTELFSAKAGSMLFAPAACRDAHSVLMRNIGPSTKTKE
jgi:cytochrome c551/c552